MMRRLFFSIAIMLCLPIMAGERSEKQILDAAARVLCGQPQARSLGAKRQQSLHIVQRRTALTIVSADGGGFALVSNDDGVRPVLGYSKEGSFDADDMPCSLKWYLNALDQSLKNIGANGYEWTPVAILPDESVKPQVEPLLETDWYQGTPFNDWCPTYVDDNGNVQHNVVGCGATATAQVMFYHRHPAVGRGEVTYSYNPLIDYNRPGEPPVNDPSVMRSLSCRFDTVFIDWNSMNAKYGNKRSNDESANIAVARLCKAVGIAMKMTYGIGGSGSGMHDAARALRENFGYSSDTRNLTRSYYADQLWVNNLFNELSHGRPIVYGGKPGPDKAGHFFVLDGYDADGLFHINWGWGNNYYWDGYFDLNYLSPNHRDTHYSELQSMVMGARPEGTPIDMMVLTLSAPGSLSALLPSNRSLRLKISGQLNADDLQTLKQLGQQVKDSDGRITAELTHLDLSEATLPDNVLPANAFEGCTALLDVVLPTSLKSVGDKAFLGCNHLIHIGMPSGLQKIGSYTFQNCTSLTDIVIPRNVESIGDAAFSACLANEAFAVETGSRHFSTVDGMLTNATRNKLVCFPAKRSTADIPAAIDSIGRFAFRYSVNLKEIRIPGTVRVVDEWAFMNCENLATVTLDEGVQRILAGAFNNCDALTTLHLPSTIDSIGRRPFIYSDNMQQVTMSGENPNFRVVNNCLLSHDGKQLVQALFTEVETVDIPASVETINEFALYYTKISHLTLPATLRKVDRQSIFFCQNLTQLDIEEGLEEINHYAFNGCSAIEEMHLPASLVNVGYGIFCNCTALRSVDISEASPLYSTDNNMLFSKDGTRLLRQLADDKEDYTVPKTVTTIDQGCFRYLNNLQRLTIPESVTSIGNYVFYGCKALTDVYCQASIPLRLGNYVFALTDLSQVTLHVPEGSRYAYSVSTGWNQFGTIVDDLPYTSPSTDYYLYHNTFNVTRSSQTAFTKLVVLAPCPQSNEYQEVHSIDYTSDGVWLHHEMQTNQNKYLELCMNSSELVSTSQDFSVGYSFTLSHKNFYIDFSPYKNSDGSWKEMPAYDTSQTDYIDNTKQSGDYVVPDNGTIKLLSDQLFSECNNNRLTYAERCYEYVASHFKYINPGTGLHTLADILSAGGGDCGNLSSIYISLLRAKGIPARHVVAISAKADNKGYSGHVWSEFYIQDFGWVPVDVSHKNGNLSGNYFGMYDGKYIVVQKGVVMDYPTNFAGTKTLNFLQLFAYWYWYSTQATLKISQDLSSHQIETLAGDANGDGKVSVTDIAVIVNHILSIPNDTGLSVAGADANGDGKITVTDIGVIVDIILGNNANARKTDVLEPQ